MRTREEIVRPLVRGKRVLDLGNSWGDFKELIREEAKEYKGLDIEPGADYRKDLNRPFDLRRKFDVIVAGELIEHLENPGVFLASAAKHLPKGGILFITTPNATSFRFFAYALLGREPEYEGHVTYYTKDALGLILKRHFRSIEIGFTNNTTNISRKDWLWRVKFHIENAIGTIVPRLSPNMYAICRR